MTSTEINEPYFEATAFGDRQRVYVSASQAQRLQEEQIAKLSDAAENIIDFEELAGQEFDFYGCDGYRFRLDDITYEFIERDGSYEIIKAKEPISGLPIARVIIEHAAFCDECYELIDLHDEHCWLDFGSWALIDSSDEPYFEYSPKALQS